MVATSTATDQKQTETEHCRIDLVETQAGDPSAVVEEIRHETGDECEPERDAESGLEDARSRLGIRSGILESNAQILGSPHLGTIGRREEAADQNITCCEASNIAVPKRIL